MFSDDTNGEMEHRICGEIPLDDLILYETLTFEAEREENIQDAIDELQSKGYGDSLKAIDHYFRSHLEGCYFCNEVFQERLTTERELSDPKKSRDFWSIVVGNR